VGAGPTLVLVNGGPGDDHTYLRPVAEALSSRFRCVLYDQRGTGHSRLQHLNDQTLHIDRQIDDLEALRAALGIERLRLVGHSWGANLALLYAAALPRNVSRVALVSLGPLDESLSAVASANLVRLLSREEREEWANLHLERKIALRQDDMESVRVADKSLMRLRVKGWFFSPEKASQFLNFYLQNVDTNRFVNEIVMRSYRRVPVWDSLTRVTAPVLVIYGYQDFEPITMAYTLQQRLGMVEVCLLNECGHLPWMEQPEMFYRELTRFLSTDSDQLQQQFQPR
jgi:proline iminopeptidase